jgi:hypothetical protein
MSSFVTAMDTYKLQQETPKQNGANNNVEYTWSSNLREKIVQLFFQMVRTNNTSNIENTLSSILQDYKKMYEYDKQQFQYNINEFVMLYKLIGQTRDIINGKGEYELSYIQIFIWHRYFPNLAYYALEKMVLFDDNFKTNTSSKSVHPYGSWKDIKYMCDLALRRTGNKYHPLIIYATDLMLKQLKQDIQLMNNSQSQTETQSETQSETQTQTLSLVSKWIPREKSKYGWIYKLMAHKYYYLTSEEMNQHKKTQTVYKQFRKTISQLNNYIDTTQIKMAGQNWSSIDFNRVTSKTMHINKLAFMNRTKSNTERKNNDDRRQCAENLSSYIKEVQNGDTNKKIHGKRVNVYELVKSALTQKTQEEQTITNLQWKDNATQNHALGNFIPMADTSGSMTTNNCIPLYNSIGLSIRISELANDAFKNRILTFSQHPEWVNLDYIENDNFVEKVKKVSRANWGMNTNFYGAMKLILDSLIQNEVDPTTVENLVLVVFSDMQIDQASSENTNTMYENIKQMFYNGGLTTDYKTPYNPPHILFWNLTSSSGFPTLSSEKNVTMLSGYSPVLLNVFCEKGLDGLREYTPFKMLCDLLNHERYKQLENYVYKMFM